MMDLFIGHTLQKGRGVFTRTDIAANTPIIRFTGPIVTGAELPHPSEPVFEHFTQIDTDLYMGPSGSFDDIINHSCDPNCGLKETAEGLVCIAIRDIENGEELSWDYSTLQNSGWWSMTCQCHSPHCRGLIGDFRDLPVHTQEKYINLGIVPQFIADEFEQSVCSRSQAGSLVSVAA